jgi:cytochrome c biogenesis protein CcdA
MTARFVLSIVAIALTDALNPTPVFACAYLLSTPKPVARVIAFISGVFTIRLLLGAALVIGFGSRINDVTKKLSSGTLGTWLQIGVGCLLVAGAICLWRKPPGKVSKRTQKGPRATGVGAAFSFGFTLTLIESPTDIPYIGALSSIARIQTSTLSEIALLILFNVLYLIPMLCLLGVWLRFGQRSIDAIDRFRSKLSRVFSDRRWAVVLGVLGIGLVIWSAMSL